MCLKPAQMRRKNMCISSSSYEIPIVWFSDFAVLDLTHQGVHDWSRTTPRLPGMVSLYAPGMLWPHSSSVCIGYHDATIQTNCCYSMM
jgi:hypothetical protein